MGRMLPRGWYQAGSRRVCSASPPVTWRRGWRARAALGRGHLWGMVLGAGGQRADLGPPMCPGSNEGQRCLWWCEQDVAREPGEGTDCPLCLVLVRPCLDTASSLGPQRSNNTDKLVGGEGRPQRQWGWSPCPARRGCGTGAGSAGRSNCFGGTQQHPWHRWEGTEETQLGSSQWYMAGG